MKKLTFLLIFAAFMLSFSTAAFAADYRPSVEQKKAPELVGREVVVKTDEGEKTVEAVAVLTGAGGIAEAGLTGGDILVTPLSEKDSVSLESVKETLTDADNHLRQDDALANLRDILNERAGAIAANAGDDDLVVRDLFDITLTGDYADTYQNDGTLSLNGSTVSLNVRFDLSLGENEYTPVVVYKCDAQDAWDVVPAEKTIRNDDGTLDVVFDRLCAVAFLTVPQNVIIEDPDVESPKTGVEEAPYEIAAAAAVLGAVILTGVFAFVKKKAK